MASVDAAVYVVDTVKSFELFKVPPRWLFLRIETTNGVVGWGEPNLEGYSDTVRPNVVYPSPASSSSSSFYIFPFVCHLSNNVSIDECSTIVLTLPEPGVRSYIIILFCGIIFCRVYTLQVATAVTEMMGSVVGEDASRIQYIWQKLYRQKFYNGGKKNGTHVTSFSLLFFLLHFSSPLPSFVGNSFATATITRVFQQSRADITHWIFHHDDVTAGHTQCIGPILMSASDNSPPRRPLMVVLCPPTREGRSTLSASSRSQYQANSAVLC